jgi:hypothetical protein
LARVNGFEKWLTLLRQPAVPDKFRAHFAHAKAKRDIRARAFQKIIVSDAARQAAGANQRLAELEDTVNPRREVFDFRLGRRGRRRGGLEDSLQSSQREAQEKRHACGKEEDADEQEGAARCPQLAEREQLVTCVR